MEWEYTRLMTRNYLQAVSRESTEDRFQCRMLTEETIKGLLKCRLHRMNGVPCLLYDITSMQSLSSIYAERKMNRADLSLLAFSLRRVKHTLEEYLLDASNLFLGPEFIFQELDTKELFFLYYPYLGEEKEERERCFAFLLSVLDHEDEPLTEFMYSLYEQIEKYEDLSWVEEVCQRLESMQEKEAESRETLERTEVFFQEETEKMETEFEMQPEEITDTPSVKERAKKALLFCGLYVAAVGGSVYYLYANYILTAEEQAMLAGGLVAITGVAAYSLYRWLKKTEKPIRMKRQPDFEFEEELPVRISEEEAFGGFKGERVSEDLYGKTMYFEAEEIENKLYGIGKNNRKMFELNKLPFTIGKKEGAVDGILADESISRMHARFFKKDQVLYLEDLNSTNGTYKNGIMLAPHEKAEVLPEDEIRFGKLRFVYR